MLVCGKDCAESLSRIEFSSKLYLNYLTLILCLIKRARQVRKPNNYEDETGEFPVPVVLGLSAFRVPGKLARNSLRGLKGAIEIFKVQT